MANIYAYASATGNNDGTTQADAYTDLQDALDAATAGDIIYARGTFSISARLDVDTNSGTMASLIQLIGVNDSWVDDGTYCVIDGQDNAISGLYINSVDFWTFKNIRIHSCDGTAALETASAYSNYFTFINCAFDDCDGQGARPNGYLRYACFDRCLFDTNTGSALYRPDDDSVFFACVFANNTGARVVDGANAGCIFSNCLFYGNSGVIYLYNGGTLLNCVIDGGTSDGVEFPSGPMCSIIGCRITNHTGTGKVGFKVTASNRAYMRNTYFENNTTNYTSGGYIDLGGNAEDQSETNKGYVDPTNNDFNLDPDNTDYYSVAVELPDALH